jgi:hypothetical protein
VLAFLGAGALISSGAPTSQELADSIASKILKTEPEAYSLQDIVDFVDGSIVGKLQQHISVKY